ncbi:MAG: hypothetical protein IPP52_02105 [Ignavibacteria bacterium]|nr:hypothetical protein [Ignavibacteria bacterium]
MKILKSHNYVFMQNCNNSYKSVFKLKIFLLILLFLVFINNIVYSQNYWIKNPSPTSLILTEVYFLNNNTGWIAGDSGAVFRTTDQGLNWIKQSTYVDNYILSIFFINENTGWAVSWDVFPDSGSFFGTIMLRTTNGG